MLQLEAKLREMAKDQRRAYVQKLPGATRVALVPWYGRFGCLLGR